MPGRKEKSETFSSYFARFPGRSPVSYKCKNEYLSTTCESRVARIEQDPVLPRNYLPVRLFASDDGYAATTTTTTRRLCFRDTEERRRQMPQTPAGFNNVDVAFASSSNELNLRGGINAEEGLTLGRRTKFRPTAAARCRQTDAANI